MDQNFQALCGDFLNKLLIPTIDYLRKNPQIFEEHSDEEIAVKIRKNENIPTSSILMPSLNGLSSNQKVKKIKEPKIKEEPISLEDFKIKYSNGEKICAFASIKGVKKDKVCAKPAVNCDIETSQMKWRCQDCLNNTGKIEKLMEPPVIGTLKPSVLVSNFNHPNLPRSTSELQTTNTNVLPPLPSFQIPIFNPKKLSVIKNINVLQSDITFSADPQYPGLVIRENKDFSLECIGKIFNQATQKGYVILHDTEMGDGWEKYIQKIDEDDKEYLKKNEIKYSG